MEGRKAVSVSEASRISGFTRRTIYNWMAEDRVQYRKSPGRPPRIFVDSLRRKAESRKSEPDFSNSSSFMMPAEY